jgi:hypothetical protein
LCARFGVDTVQQESPSLGSYCTVHIEKKGFTDDMVWSWAWPKGTITSKSNARRRDKRKQNALVFSLGQMASQEGRRKWSTFASEV